MSSGAIKAIYFIPTTIIMLAVTAIKAYHTPGYRYTRQEGYDLKVVVPFRGLAF